MSKDSAKGPPKMTPFVAALVGGVAGALEITFAYPMEFTKVIMQLYPDYNKLGVLSVMKKTIKQDGLFGLYKGYNLLLLAGVPKAYVRFGTFEYLKQNVFTNNTVLNTTICGAIAGTIEGLFVHVPVENVKVKLIHDRFKTPPQFRNLFHGIYKVCSEQGYNGMTAGTTITMLKEGSNHAIRFPLFLGLQKVFTPFLNNNVIRDLIAGGMTGILCVMINQPLDVIKTNLQGLDAHKFTGIADVAKQIIKKEGLLGMYRGVKPRMARVAIEVSVTFASYNTIRDAILRYLAVGE